MTGIIYQVTNKENGFKYIGATSNSLKQRKWDHVERAKRGEENKFHNAISTFGEDAFEWVQIDTATTSDELAQKEKQYILEYNSKEDGYNSDSGGGIKKTVYKYHLISGKLVSTYKSLTEAAQSICSTKQRVSTVCLSVNKLYKGFYWSYESKEPFVPNKDLRKKEVYQISLDGHILAKYVSVSEASRRSGVSKTCISRVCRGERLNSGGYIWQYE